MNLRTLTALLFLLSIPCFAEEEESPFGNLIDRLKPTEENVYEQAEQEILSLLVDGDYETAVAELIRLGEKSTADFKALEPGLALNDDGSSRYYESPTNELLENILRSKDDIDPVVFFEMLGTLFNKENRGAGYRLEWLSYNSLHRYISKFPCMQSKRQPLHQFEELADQLSKLSEDGQKALNLAIIGWMRGPSAPRVFATNLNSISQYQNSQKIPPATLDAIVTGLILRVGQTMSLNHVHSSAQANFYGGRESFINYLTDSSIPVQFRYPVGWFSGTFAIGALNDPAALAAILDLAEQSETKFGYPPASPQRLRLHENLQANLSHPECIRLASDALQEWSDRVLEGGMASPGGKLPESNVPAPIAIFTTAGDYDRILPFLEAHQGEWLTGKPTIILGLIAAGDFEEAANLMPEDGDFSGMRASRYSPRLMQQLDAYFEERGSESLQLSLEAAILRLSHESTGALHGDKIGILNQPERVKQLLGALDEFSNEKQVRILSGFYRFPDHLPELREVLENIASEESLADFCDRPDSVTLSLALSRYHSARFGAAYEAGDWELAADLLAQVVDLVESEPYQINNYLPRMTRCAAKFVVNDLAEANPERCQAALEFWRSLTVAHLGNPTESHWVSESAPFAFSRLFDAILNEKPTTNDWIAKQSKGVRRELNLLARSAPQGSLYLLLACSDRSITWRHLQDSFPLRASVLSTLFDNPNLVRNELYALHTFRMAKERILDPSDLSTFSSDKKHTWLARAYLAQGDAWTVRSTKTERDLWLPIITSLEAELTETSNLHADLSDLLKVTRASIIGRDGDPAAGLKILDTIKGDLHPELKKRIDIARRTLSKIQN